MKAAGKAVRVSKAQNDSTLPIKSLSNGYLSGKGEITVDISDLANYIEVGVFGCFILKLVWGRGAIAYAGWSGEQRGLFLLWGLVAAVPVTLSAITFWLWLPPILRYFA